MCSESPSSMPDTSASISSGIAFGMQSSVISRMLLIEHAAEHDALRRADEMDRHVTSILLLEVDLVEVDMRHADRARLPLELLGDHGATRGGRIAGQSISVLTPLWLVSSKPLETGRVECDRRRLSAAAVDHARHEPRAGGAFAPRPCRASRAAPLRMSHHPCSSPCRPPQHPPVARRDVWEGPTLMAR